MRGAVERQNIGKDDKGRRTGRRQKAQAADYQIQHWLAYKVLQDDGTTAITEYGLRGRN
jgi:hypothetical protein